MNKRLFLLVSLIAASVSLRAQSIPQNMSYQGYVTDLTGSPVADGTYNLTVAMYTAESGGVALWTETHPTVAVSRGLFNVVLGRGNPPNPLAIQFDQQYFLGIRINPDPEMTPRVRLTTSAYSFRAKTADAVRDGAVTDASVAANAQIAASKLESAILTESEIVAGSGVTVNNAGGTLTISASSGATSLAGDVTGPAGANIIANNAVTATKILPDIVSSISGISNDAGNISLVAGANVTITPDDAANTITIAATGGGGGLALPYSSSTNSAASPWNTAFGVEQTGLSGAARFAVNNTGSANDALRVINNGTSTNADAIRAEASGGNAIECYNSHATTPTIYAYNSGGGTVAQFGTGGTSAADIMKISKSGGSGHGINVTYGGSGSGVYVDNNSAGSGLELKQDGTGNAAYFHIDNTSSTANALRAQSSSTNQNSDALEVVAAAGNGLDATNNSALTPTIYAKNNSSSSTAPVISTSGGFRTDASGKTTSPSFVASTILDTGIPAIGGVYGDNTVVAWGRMSTGTLLEGFGVASVSTNTSGPYNIYTITLQRTMANGNSLIPIVSVWHNAPRFAAVTDVNSNSFGVNIFNWNNTTKAWDNGGGPWYFVVLGRP
jgi:hypothetical protein